MKYVSLPARQSARLKMQFEDPTVGHSKDCFTSSAAASTVTEPAVLRSVLARRLDVSDDQDFARRYWIAAFEARFVDDRRPTRGNSSRASISIVPLRTAGGSARACLLPSQRRYTARGEPLRRICPPVLGGRATPREHTRARAVGRTPRPRCRHDCRGDRAEPRISLISH